MVLSERIIDAVNFGGFMVERVIEENVKSVRMVSLEHFKMLWNVENLKGGMTPRLCVSNNTVYVRVIFNLKKPWFCVVRVKRSKTQEVALIGSCVDRWLLSEVVWGKKLGVRQISPRVTLTYNGVHIDHKPTMGVQIDHKRS